ncbi:MAG: prepilin-type N-terminal cleavage/methylation domain-containing protein [bacterium]
MRQLDLDTTTEKQLSGGVDEPPLRGFTLVELLVTMGIVTIAVLPLMLSYTHLWQATISSERKTTATMLAQQRLEIISGSKSYDEITGSSSGTFNTPYNMYDYEVSVESLSSEDPDFSAKQLKVRILFPSIYGGNRTLSCPDNPDCDEWDHTKIITELSP